MRLVSLVLCALLSVSTSYAQTNAPSGATDSMAVQIRAFYDEALVRGEAYRNLESLCKKIGARLSGSPASIKAAEWGLKTLFNAGADSVFLQPVLVPHWVRGKSARYEIRLHGKPQKLNACALGMSVETPKSGIQAKVVMVSSVDELKKLGKEKVQGKIVFFNQAFNPANIRTFESYGQCVWQRVDGAVHAAALGAKAVVIRSMSSSDDDYPHTGVMHYEDSIPKIPAAALGVRSAKLLAEAVLKNPDLDFFIQQDCKTLPDTINYNVVGEWKAKKRCNSYVVVGGHLDSWDLGEGAHDDGAGIVQSIEVLRILKKLKYRGNHNLRVVLFANEENGAKGAIEFARLAAEKGERIVAGLESDAGGFTPRGFNLDKIPDGKIDVQRIKNLFEPYGLLEIVSGGSGVDVGKLRKPFPEIVLSGYRPDSQRYFDLHHAANDVFENVHRRELELGAASMTAMVYLLMEMVP